MKRSSRLVAADLFCGAGGFGLGLVNSGFDIAYAADAWPLAVESYNLNFTHQAELVDLSATEVAVSALEKVELDLICGGPPCQGFSIQRIGSDIDTRNDLVFAFGQIVLATRPKAFLLENVTGLLGARGRSVFERFTNTMRSEGYFVEFKILNALDFGVPQSRRRVFVLGSRRDLDQTLELPSSGSEGQSNVRMAIGDLPAPWIGRRSGEADPLHRMIGMSPINKRRIELIPPGGGFEDLPIDMRVACHKNGAARIGHRAVYGRMSPDKPASTITARFDSFTRGRFGHPWEPRNITLREGARLQSFPDSHRFAGNQEDIAAQIGNAVPPRMATHILQHLALQIQGCYPKKVCA